MSLDLNVDSVVDDMNSGGREFHVREHLTIGMNKLQIRNWHMLLHRCMADVPFSLTRGQQFYTRSDVMDGIGSEMTLHTFYITLFTYNSETTNMSNLSK